MSPWTMSRRLRIEAVLPDSLSGNWHDDFRILSRARSLAIPRDAEDSIPAEDGSTVLPYTRYGDWYSFPYGEWCVMFVLLCKLRRYSAPPCRMNPAASRWSESSGKPVCLRVRQELCPRRGDLVFVSYDGGLDALASVSSPMLPQHRFRCVQLCGYRRQQRRYCARASAPDDRMRSSGVHELGVKFDSWNGTRRALIDCGGCRSASNYPAEEAADFDTLRAVSVNKSSRYSQLVQKASRLPFR